MNKRIKELMVEAGYAAPEIAGRAHKLADLIIKDCVNRAKLVGKLNKEPVEPVNTAHAIEVSIKKHFGIK